MDPFGLIRLYIFNTKLPLKLRPVKQSSVLPILKIFLLSIEVIKMNLNFKSDIFEDVITSVETIILALDFGIQSGFRALYGLYPAIILDFFTILLGIEGTNTHIKGPTGRIAVISTGILSNREGDSSDTWPNKHGLYPQLKSQIYTKHFDHPLFFELIIKFKESNIQTPDILHVILRTEQVPYIDQNAIYTLKEILEGLQKHNITVMLSSLNPSNCQLISQSHIIPQKITEQHLFENFNGYIKHKIEHQKNRNSYSITKDIIMNITTLFETWNRALATGKTEEVLACYADDAVLLPTLSNKLCQNKIDIAEYFDSFLKKGPQGEILEECMRVLDKDLIINSGIYKFSFANDASSAQARFTFLYRKDESGWKIIEHHSSLLPL